MARRLIDQIARGAAPMVLFLMALMLIPGTAQAATCAPSAVEKAFVAEVNRQRSSRGLGKLKLDPQLSTAAVFHTNFIRSRRALIHTTASALRKRVKRSGYLAENLGSLADATSATPAAQARAMVRLFMNSPLHRKNLLRAGRYKYQGVGILYQGSTLWITHLFAGKQDPGTTVRTRLC